MEEIYRKRTSLMKELAAVKASPGEIDSALKSVSAPKRYDDAMNCHYIGFDESTGGLCCLAYERNEYFTPGMKKFFDDVCRKFECGAWEMEPEKIRHAAVLFRDWFHYSMLINMPGILDDLTANNPDGALTDEYMSEVSRLLEKGLREISPAALKSR